MPSDQVYYEAFRAAVKEFRELSVELQPKMMRLADVKAAVRVLAEKASVEMPPDIRLTFIRFKRGKDPRAA